MRYSVQGTMRCGGVEIVREKWLHFTKKHCAYLESGS